MTDFTLVKDSQGSSLLITLNDGEVLAVPGTHVRFSDVVDYLLETEDDLDEDYIRDLTDIVGQAGTALTSLSDRVKVSGNVLLYDGDPIDSSLSRHILRLVSEGDAVGWKSLVNFLEKVQQNPVEHSRENLYSWIADRDFTLLPNGDLILYKGVSVDDEGLFWSINSGTAIVNDVVVSGLIPNQPGSVIEMPRSKVQANPGVGCSTGLHGGTYAYASDFSRGGLLTIQVNPADVVSVPTDCEAQKMRVCRYTVLSAVEHEYLGTVWDSESEDDDFDDLEWEEVEELAESGGPEGTDEEGLLDDVELPDFDEEGAGNPEDWEADVTVLAGGDTELGEYLVEEFYLLTDKGYEIADAYGSVSAMAYEILTSDEYPGNESGTGENEPSGKHRAQ